MKTVGYIIVEEDSQEDLERQVRKHIDEDWCPIGGVSIRTFSSGDPDFYQAMVKYETASPVSDFKTMQMWVGG